MSGSFRDRIEDKSLDRPVKVLIYGVAGVGKSTFGANSDNPIILSTEGKVLRSDVDEIKISSWKDLCKITQSLIDEAHEYKTFVLDSADWTERILHAYIVGEFGKGRARSMKTVGGGYGAGYVKAEETLRKYLRLLNDLQDKKDMNVIITAHYQIKRVKDPDAEHDYDAYELKCHEKFSQVLREWVDEQFFVRFKIDFQESEEHTKAIGSNERIAYTTMKPSYQAKNGLDMPESIPFKKDFWSVYMQHVKKYKAAQGIKSKKEILDEILSEIQSQMNLLDKDKDNDLQAKITKALAEAKGDPQTFRRILARLKEINSERIKESFENEKTTEPVEEPPILFKPSLEESVGSSEMSDELKAVNQVVDYIKEEDEKKEKEKDKTDNGEGPDPF